MLGDDRDAGRILTHKVAQNELNEAAAPVKPVFWVRLLALYRATRSSQELLSEEVPVVVWMRCSILGPRGPRRGLVKSSRLRLALLMIRTKIQYTQQQQKAGETRGARGPGNPTPGHARTTPVYSGVGSWE